MMMNESKVSYLQDVLKLVGDAQSYEVAASHSSYLKGMVSAWHLDGTVSSADYLATCDTLETIMIDKRKLS